MGVKVRGAVFFILTGLMCLMAKGEAYAGEYTFTWDVGMRFVSEDTNVRSEPSVNGELLGQIPAESSFRTFRRCNETGWYEIFVYNSDYDSDKKYYISDKYVMDFKLDNCHETVKLLENVDIIKWPLGSEEVTGSIEEGAVFDVMYVTEDGKLYYIDNKYGKGFIPASQCVVPTPTPKSSKLIFAVNEKGEPWYVRAIYFLFKLFIVAVVIFLIVIVAMSVKTGEEEKRKRMLRGLNGKYDDLKYPEYAETVTYNKVSVNHTRQKSSDDCSVLGIDWDGDGEVSFADDFISMDLLDEDFEDFE